jgi:hypothetical protein
MNRGTVIGTTQSSLMRSARVGTPRGKSSMAGIRLQQSRTPPEILRRRHKAPDRHRGRSPGEPGLLIFKTAAVRLTGLRARTPRSCCFASGLGADGRAYWGIVRRVSAVFHRATSGWESPAIRGSGGATAASLNIRPGDVLCLREYHALTQVANGTARRVQHISRSGDRSACTRDRDPIYARGRRVAAQLIANR